MADEDKHSWWKSMPGTLTAATGFVAALSGLVAGLNQLGVFRREPPAAQTVVAAPAPRESTPGQARAPVSGGSASSTAPAPAPGPARSAAAPAGAPGPTARAGRPTDTTGAESRLPKGTPLELAVPSRTCAPADGLKRFTARLVTPVKAGGATVLPASTTAVLRVRRSGSPAAPQVRLDSLVRPDLAIAMPPSDVRLRHGAASGACLRANARITVTLGAAVPLRHR